jgi:hypothetical protein
MQVGRVAEHPGVGRLEARLELDAGREGRRQQIERLVDHGLRIEQDLIGETAAAEAENAFDQQLRALGRVNGVVEIAPQIAVAGGMLRCEFPITQNGAEHVVEIVGDAARQRTDGFHLL